MSQNERKSKFNKGRKMSYIWSGSLLLSLLLLDNIAVGDYENTWITYHEQPCCNENSNLKERHLRHHKGTKLFFILLNCGF